VERREPWRFGLGTNSSGPCLLASRVVTGDDPFARLGILFSLSLSLCVDAREISPTRRSPPQILSFRLNIESNPIVMTIVSGQQPAGTSWAALLAQKQDPSRPPPPPPQENSHSHGWAPGASAPPHSNPANDQREHQHQQRPTHLVPKEQICFDFTKGQCRRGASCKFSHDVAHIIHVNSQEKGICFDFLKGTCARGVLCRFSHDLNNLPGGVALQHGPSSGSASASMSSGGNADANARKLPICYDFVKNKCGKGDACKYSHDYAAILSNVSGRVGGSGGRSPGGAGQQRAHRGEFALVGDQQHPQQQHPQQYQRQTCVDYLRGNCPRGPFCELAHCLPAALIPPRPTGHAARDPDDAQQVEHAESLESLITRLKKMQYEEAMIAKNTMQLAGHDMSLVGMPFSYPPGMAMHSEGARMMHAHWYGRHEETAGDPYHPFASENRNVNQHVNNQPFTNHRSVAMSPPVTHAEKARISAHFQMQRQQGVSRFDDQSECGSPMIGAAWNANQPPSAAADLMNMLTMRSIWPEEGSADT